MVTTATPHVFVVHGDLTELACDAIMIPTDSRLSTGPHWHAILPEHRLLTTEPLLESFRRGETFAAALPSASSDPAQQDSDSRRMHAPIRVLTAVPLEGFTSVDELRPRIRGFVDVAASALMEHRESAIGSGQKRALPLIAMPLFASNGGGGGWRRASLLDTVLDEARAAGLESDVDIALVLRNEADVALAQQRRRSAGADSWTALEPRLAKIAKSLAKSAIADRMVPFMGAGVSMSAGAPSWKSLLRDLADAINLSGEMREALFASTVPELDQATFLARQFESLGEPFRETVAHLVERPRYGLAPVLLAMTADEQAITLNYDTLFERACTACGRPRRILTGGSRGDAPAAPNEPTDRWLLKLHGTADDPQTIVLTRDDYLGFAADRSALSAIVKATLLTRHLLFVGFGLADDHFHEILHDVKQAVGTTETSATALTLFADPLSEGLWAGSLSVVPMVESTASDENLPGAARTLEVFLDMLAAHSTDSESYLRNDQYEEGLTSDERVVRDHLLALERVAGRQYGPVKSGG